MAIIYQALIVNPRHVVLCKFITCYVEFLVRIPTAECLMVRKLQRFPNISSSVFQKGIYLVLRREYN
jgi:hypothetical protein